MFSSTGVQETDAGLHGVSEEAFREQEQVRGAIGVGDKSEKG